MQEVLTRSATETKHLAKKLATSLKGGEAVLLYGDLGAGKTTFAQGLAEGLEIKDNILSPTFVIRRSHQGKINLIHYDFYRLESPSELETLDVEADISPQNVVLIEWPDKINYESKNAIKIYFQDQGQDERIIKSEAFS